MKETAPPCADACRRGVQHPGTVSESLAEGADRFTVQSYLRMLRRVAGSNAAMRQTSARNARRSAGVPAGVKAACSTSCWAQRGARCGHSPQGGQQAVVQTRKAPPRRGQGRFAAR